MQPVEAVATGGDTVPQRGPAESVAGLASAGHDALPQSPGDGAAGLGSGAEAVRDSVPSSPLEGSAGLGEAGGGLDTVPFRGDATPMPDGPDLQAPLNDMASASAVLDGGAGKGLTEAAQGFSLDGAGSPLTDAAQGFSLDGVGSSLTDAARGFSLDGAQSSLTEAARSVEGGFMDGVGSSLTSIEGVFELPQGLERAPLDGIGSALEQDAGEFVDAAGQGWDLQSPADIFRSGPNAGERMPDGQPGRYDGDIFEQQLDGALAKGLNVIVDTSGLSRESNADARRRADAHPDWASRVRFS
ncbi:hypothetical protein ACQP00_28140 [Dactylosporangium sp. CS-047395]|uniref:hypothetical protein n=1 Tax=Dactylosporangium sp. CS-047395 TaxID=3239936 RepID=UPI003D8FFB42